VDLRDELSSGNKAEIIPNGTDFKMVRQMKRNYWPAGLTRTRKGNLVNVNVSNNLAGTFSKEPDQVKSPKNR